MHLKKVIDSNKLVLRYPHFAIFHFFLLAKQFALRAKKFYIVMGNKQYI